MDRGKRPAPRRDRPRDRRGGHSPRSPADRAGRDPYPPLDRRRQACPPVPALLADVLSQAVGQPLTLKLTVSAPLILAAERMLGGTARALNHEHKGFDIGAVTALEEVTSFFTQADASKGGGLYRSAIVAQLDEVARRIQDGVPPKLKDPGVRGNRRPRGARGLGQP
ncbi:hypothetical protein ACFYXC_40040 [Streptomyces sp. NPDC002701]|uniref:hypothetical protein n=1 Tax=Streptomyces sp. NPDC002701 TaxID=3364661 RepID=UPI00367A4DF7